MRYSKSFIVFLEKKAHESRDEVSEILRMFNNNITFTRAARSIDSKISNKDFFCRYCWPLLCCL